LPGRCSRASTGRHQARETPRHAQARVARSGAHTERCDLRGNHAFDRRTQRRAESAIWSPGPGRVPATALTLGSERTAPRRQPATHGWERVVMPAAHRHLARVPGARSAYPCALAQCGALIAPSSARGCAAAQQMRRTMNRRARTAHGAAQPRLHLGAVARGHALRPRHSGRRSQLPAHRRPARGG